MDLVFIFKSLIGLIVLLGILIAILLFKPSKKKKNISKSTQKKESVYTFLELSKIVKDKNSATQLLQWALDVIVKYHGKIKPKDGSKVNDDFYNYSEIIIRICRHPNTTKELILNFDKALRERNPEYSKEINDSLTKGIKSRKGS